MSIFDKILKFIKGRPLGYVSAIIFNPTEDTYLDIERHFGVLVGVQHPGYDNPSQTATIAYSPELITEAEILERFKTIGYEWKQIDPQ